MFGIGFTEIVVIGIILIVAVGPERMPGFLRAVLRGYREFRKATRDLRASTGIDEILQDEELKSLRNPLYVAPAAKAATAASVGLKPAAGKNRKLSEKEYADEVPPEGVDLAEARAAEREPDAEAVQRRNAKIAVVTREEEVIAAKEALAAKRTAVEAGDAEEIEEDRILKQKLAALEDERVRAKIAAAVPEDDGEEERVVNQKIAAALARGEDVPLPPPKGKKPIETEEQRQRREAKEASLRSAPEE
jgi:Tat protein translocase TatB subunit